MPRPKGQQHFFLLAVLEIYKQSTSVADAAQQLEKFWKPATLDGLT